VTFPPLKKLTTTNFDYSKIPNAPIVFKPQDADDILIKMKNRLNGIYEDNEDGSSCLSPKKRCKVMQGNAPFEQPGSGYFKQELAERQS
jgi:hypothetical protein